MDAPRQPIVLERLGGRLLGAVAYLGGLSVLLGQCICLLAASCASRDVSLGWRRVARQMVRVGVSSVPIVVLVQVFIGVILALQLTPPLKFWGQQEEVSRIIGLAGFRMMGPIITAVVLSGFAGASIAAELGTMKVSEEIEALEAIALDPLRFLVLPRVLATFAVTVLLTAVGDLAIALGGYLAALTMGPSTHVTYWRHMQASLHYQDLYTGLAMAAIFGLLVGLIACHEGLKVSRGAEGVGRATTMTVVNSIVAIILSAAAFTTVFYVFRLYDQPKG